MKYSVQVPPFSVLICAKHCAHTEQASVGEYISDGGVAIAIPATTR